MTAPDEFGSFKKGKEPMKADDRVRRFVGLRKGGVAGVSGLDDPEGLLADLLSWCRGERRIASPLSTDDVTRAIVGLAIGQKDAIEAVASLAANGVQCLAAER
jgi:hypothetical protein